VYTNVHTKSTYLQLIIPYSLKRDFMRNVHSKVGRTRTKEAVRLRAYGVGWTGDVRLMLNMCPECARYKREKLTHRTPLSSIVVGGKWDLVSIDITGPHPTSRDGFNFILTLQDHYSEWTEAFPIRRHTAPVVARALFDQVFLRFECPVRLHSDQRSEFENVLFHELCVLIQRNKIHTSPYFPQGNGMIERWHRCFNPMLGIMVAANQRDYWSDHIPTILAAYRATVHESTKCTPNRVF